MEYQTINASKSRSTAPGGLRAVRRNTMMLHQHKEERHTASVERMQRLKAEKAEQEEQAQQRECSQPTASLTHSHTTLHYTALPH